MRSNYVIDSIIDSGLIKHGSYIIVGFSGGPDSLCMLHSLAQIADSYDLTLIPVHINHLLRPEAGEEAQNAADICDRLGLECECFEVDCKQTAKEMKVSTEEAGRFIRYQIFDDVASSLLDDGIPREKILIAVAHNADDQSETVLFRLLRGTGSHGLSGMASIRPSDRGFLIIRPLLYTTRAEIEDYIRENKLHPNIDSSNEGTDYTRNKIRNELIPYLEKNYNPNIRMALRRFAMNAESDDAFISDIAAELGEGCIVINPEGYKVMLDISELKDCPPAINSRIIGYIFQILGLESSSSHELVTSMMGMIYSDNPSSSLDLPEGYRASREYDTIYFVDSDTEMKVKPDESLKMFPQVMMAKDFHPDEEVMYAAFDFDKFNDEHPGKVGDLKLRTRQEGDYIPMKEGRKKIQDLFVDSKVKKNARDSLLMVAIGNEVLWVLPSKYFRGRREQEKGRFSPKYHITDTTERVLLIEIADNL